MWIHFHVVTQQLFGLQYKSPSQVKRFCFGRSLQILTPNSTQLRVQQPYRNLWCLQQQGADTLLMLVNQKDQDVHPGTESGNTKNWEIKIKCSHTWRKVEVFLYTYPTFKKTCMENTDLHLPHSSCTFMERWSCERAVKRLRGSPVWLYTAGFKSNQLLDKTKLGLNQNSHWTNILTSLIKPLMNLEKRRAENRGLLVQWAWAETGDRWAFTELWKRTLELVTNTLNVKHPSLVFIGTGVTEAKGNTLT